LRSPEIDSPLRPEAGKLGHKETRHREREQVANTAKHKRWKATEDYCKTHDSEENGSQLSTVNTTDKS
jgi:hypothetical protein